jgi:hypothetical protein
MAYVLPIEDEEEDKKAEGEEISKQASGGPAAGEPVSAGGEAPSQKTPTTTGYTDVRSYLEANRPQATALGQTYAQRIGSEEAGFRGKIGETEQQFGTKVGESKISYDEPFVQQTISGAGKGWEPDQLEKFTKLRQAEYGGPQSLYDVENYSKLASDISGASQFGKGIETGDTLNEMFYRYGTRPTAGNVALDKMLLMGTPEARAAITEQGQKLGTLKDYLGEREKSAQEQATSAKEETAATRAATQSALQQGITGFETGLGEKVTQQRQGAAAQEAALRDFLLNYQNQSLRDKALQGQLPLEEGLPTSGYYNLANVLEMLNKSYGASPAMSGYYKTIGTPETMINTPNVATAEDYAREAALGELAGYDLPILWESDKAMAGTAPKDLAKFDIQRAYTEQLADLRKRDREYITTAKPNVDYGIPYELLKKNDPEKYKKYFESYERMARNYDILTPLQKQFVDIMQGKEVPGSPWNVTQPLPKPPEIPKGIEQELAPWTEGPRTKWIEDPTGTLPMSERYKWWDGKQWIKAPPEFKYTKNGEPSSPFDADRIQKFDYNTGKYGDIPITGGIPPGIVRIQPVVK